MKFWLQINLIVIQMPFKACWRTRFFYPIFWPQFLMKNIITFCAICAFFVYKWARGRRSSGNSLSPPFQKPLYWGLIVGETILVAVSRYSSFSVVFYSFWPFLFLAFDLFLRAATKGWKESIGFPDAEVYAETFCIKKIKYSRTSSDPDFLDVTILPISGHLRTTQENQNRSIRSRRISCI